MTNTPDILKKIVSVKREEVAEARRSTPLDELKSRLADMEDIPRGFARALIDSHASGWTTVIAEVKKGSPSKGVIRQDFDPLEIARIYEQNGAACISVLTDEKFFLGNLRYLSIIREQVRLPLLRKDFLFDPYQVYEARTSGADAILLIAAMLESSQIKELADLASELHLDVLLEIHNEQELATALASECKLIGINNRNLHTFVVDLGTTERLAPLIPSDRLVIAESGINNRADILRLQKGGAHAFLIGEALVKESDMASKLGEFLGDLG